MEGSVNDGDTLNCGREYPIDRCLLLNDRPASNHETLIGTTNRHPSQDQVKSSESHNHSENERGDLVETSKKFPRLYNHKRLHANPDLHVNIQEDYKWFPQAPLSAPIELPSNVFTNGSSPLFKQSGDCAVNNNNNNNRAISKSVKRLVSSDSGESNKSSKSGHKSRLPRSQPPDGGWGWVVVFASFMISMIADGISFSYGFFLMDLTEYFGQSKSKTALVGSLLLSMPALTGPLASALTDRYGCRTMTIVSGLLSAFGFVLGSFAQKLEHLFIAFAITGIGLSLSYVTSIVIVAYYFNNKRSLATGLAVCGTGIGTFLFAPLTTYLLRGFGWRDTLLIMSGFFLNIIVFGALMRDINVSDGESICSQDSDSDAESVMDTLGGSNRGNPNCVNNNQTNNRLKMQASNNNFSPSPALSYNSRDNLSSKIHNDPLNCSSEVPCDVTLFHPSNHHHHHHHDFPATKVDSSLKNYSSLVNIPTYIRTDGLVSKDILKEISGRKDGNLNQLIQRYPNLLSLIISREDKSMCISSGILDGSQIQQQEKASITDETISKDGSFTREFAGSGDYRRRKETCDESSMVQSSMMPTRKDPVALRLTHRGLKVPRASLTYRTALFNNMKRYRSRASSAPDIFHNSMVTIAERAGFLYDIKRVLKDMVDVSIFKNFRFALFCLSNLILHGCIDVPYVYLPDHTILAGICAKDSAFGLISVIGIANTLGTIIVGYIGDKPWLTPSTWYSGLTALGGISMALFPLVRNYYIVAILSACFGLSVSANYTLASVILVEIISLDKFTNAYGLLLMVQGIASMTGPPLAGWLYDISGNYDLAFYASGLCVFFSGVMVLPLRESPSSSTNGSSVIESTSRPSSPSDDKITALSVNKPLFDKEAMP